MINISKNKLYFFLIPVAVIIAGLIMYFVNGFNLSADFAGSNDMLWMVIKASLLTIGIILVYLAMRFDLLFGISSAVALILNMLVMLSAYLIFKMPVNTAFIACVLAALVYSLNDSTFFFDRVREDTRLSRREPFCEIANKSINNNITRFVNTTAATLIIIVVLCIVGGGAIRQLAFGVGVGVISGAYSSIFIAAPVWVSLRGERVDNKGKPINRN